MKIYNSFKEIFKTQSNIKNDVATFNRVVPVLTMAPEKRWYVQDNETKEDIFVLYEDNERKPDALSRMPFFMNLDSLALVHSCNGMSKGVDYYDGLSGDETQKLDDDFSDARGFLRGYCSAKISNYFATHGIEAKGTAYASFEGYIPSEAIDAFTQYLDNLIGECKNNFNFGDKL